MEEFRIDPELNDVLPDLSDEDYKALEQSLLTDGFKGAPIMVWGDVIVDGHNRYEICRKHNISYDIKEVDFESKEDAMRWMVRQQIGRRTLTPLQRIKVVEKYRPFYVKKAKENKSLNGGDKKSELQKSSTPPLSMKKIDVRAELAKDANVSTDTYSKGLKILHSEDVDLINQTMNGEKSINKAYKELAGQQNKKQYESEMKEMISDSKNDESASTTMLNEDIEKLNQIREQYIKYLEIFQSDIAWLTAKEFVKEDEDVTGKVRSDLKNCLERFRSIEHLMNRMQISDWDEATVMIE